jgi:hypothetical protein
LARRKLLESSRVPMMALPDVLLLSLHANDVEVIGHCYLACAFYSICWFYFCSSLHVLARFYALQVISTCCTSFSSVTPATLGRASLAPNVDAVIRTFVERMSLIPSNVFVPWLLLQRRVCDVALPRAQMRYCQVIRDRSQIPDVFNMIEESTGKTLLSAQYMAGREEYCITGPPPDLDKNSIGTNFSIWNSNSTQPLGRVTPPFIVGALSRNILCTEWNMWDSGLDPSREGHSFLPIPRRRSCGYVSYGVNIFGTHPRSLTCMFRTRALITCTCCS